MVEARRLSWSGLEAVISKLRTWSLTTVWMRETQT